MSIQISNLPALPSFQTTDLFVVARPGIEDYKATSTQVATYLAGLIPSVSVVAIVNGGTGQTTANASLNALLPAQASASGKVLQSDGTNTSWASFSSSVTLTGDVTGSGTGSLSTTLAAENFYPLVPSTLVAYGTSNGVYISWASAQWGTSYDLQSSPDNSTWSNLSMGQAGISYSDLTGHTYYRVRSKNTQGNSAYTSGVQVAVPAANLLTWLRSVHGFTTSTWTDQSAAGHNATDISSGHPFASISNVINGQPSVRSTDGNAIMDLGNINPTTGSFSKVVLVKISDLTKSNNVLSGAFSTGEFLLFGGSQFPFTANWTSSLVVELQSTVGVGSDWAMVVATKLHNTDPNGPGTTNDVWQEAIYVNGICGGISQHYNTYHPTGTDVAVGGGPSNAGQGLYGDLLEVMLLSSVPNGKELNNITNMVNATYGLSLPLFQRQVLFLGDSITAGAGATNNIGSWASLFTARHFNEGNYYVNMGRPGAAASDFITDLSASTYPFTTCGLPTYCTVALGTNDINTISAAATYANLVTLCNDLKANGVSKILVTTVLPRSSIQSTVDSLNALIAAGWYTFADAFVDYRLIPMGISGANTNTLWYNVDGVHPNDFGNLQMANLLEFHLFSMINGSPQVFNGASPSFTINSTGHVISAKNAAVNTIYASKTCAVNSNLSTGGGTDDTAAIQTSLNSLGVSGGIFVQDGVSLISGVLLNGTTQTAALMVPSNVTIHFLPGSGWFLAANSNCCILSNAGITGVIGSTPDTNISIKAYGFAINGNAANQNKFEQANSGFYFNVGCWFGNITNLIIDGLWLKDIKTYGLQIQLASVVRIYNYRQYQSTQISGSNTDALHLWGPIDDLETDNLWNNGTDDTLALNTNEGVQNFNIFSTTSNFFGYFRLPNSGNGSITNCTFRRTFFDGAWSGFRIYGVSGVSGSSPSVDNIRVIESRGSIGNVAWSESMSRIGENGTAIGLLQISDWKVGEVNTANGIQVCTLGGAGTCQLLRLENIDPSTTVGIGSVVSTDGDYFSSGSITISDSDTNTIVNPLVLNHKTSATPTAGLGVALEFAASSTTNVTPQFMGIISSTWLDATGTSPKSGLNFDIRNAGSGRQTVMTLDNLGNELVTGSVKSPVIMSQTNLATGAMTGSTVFSTTSTAAASPTLVLQKVHNNTIGVNGSFAGATVTTEVLGQLVVAGVRSAGDFGQVGGSIQFVQNGSASTFVPTDIIFSSTTGSSGLIEYMRISNSGSIIIGAAAIATNATDGFLYIPSCAGAPTGTPTTHTGTAPMVYDTTDNKLYVYNGAWKSVTLS